MGRSASAGIGRSAANWLGEFATAGTGRFPAEETGGFEAVGVQSSITARVGKYAVSGEERSAAA